MIVKIGILLGGIAIGMSIVALIFAFFGLQDNKKKYKK